MSYLFLLIPLVFLASGVGTVTGFGTSTIMMPVLMFFFPTVEVLVFVSIIHWANALWRLILFRKGFDVKLVMSFGLCGIAAAYLGAKSFFMVDEVLMQKFISVFLFLYAAYLLLKPSFEVQYDMPTASAAGAISGFVAGIFGMGGAIRGAFLTAFNLPKDVYLANSALLLMLIDTSRLITYYTEGISFNNLLGLDWKLLLSCVVIALIGVQTGKMVVDKISQRRSRQIIAIFLMVIAVKLFFS